MFCKPVTWILRDLHSHTREGASPAIFPKFSHRCGYHVFLKLEVVSFVLNTDTARRPVRRRRKRSTLRGY